VAAAEAVAFDLLDKPLVLDARQEAVRNHAPPSSSSAPPARARPPDARQDARGDRDVLYVTLSAYLAQTARRLYGAHGYENPQQSVEFMSFREFVDSIAIPKATRSASPPSALVRASPRRPQGRSQAADAMRCSWNSAACSARRLRRR